MRQIAIEVGGVTVTGTLFDDKASKTADAVWGSLPISTELRHARRSGNAAYLVSSSLVAAQLPIENQVSFCYPGSICLLPAQGTFLFAYGQAQARNEDGNVWATHLGEIDGDTSAFFALLADTQRKGLKPITMRRMEG